jgi:hypothetical protein
VKLTLSEIATRRIELEVPFGDRLRTVRLDGLTGMTGQVSRGGAGYSLRPLTAEEATVALIDWPLENGQIALDNPATVARLAFEAEVGTDGSGFHGRAQAGSVVARALKLALGERRIACDARARDLVIDQSAVAGSVAAESLELGDLQSALGALLVRWSRAVFDRLRVDWQSDGGALFATAGGAVNGLALTGPGVELEVARVELPGGLRTSGRTVAIPELVIPELVITIADVSELLRRPAAAPAAAAPAVRKPVDLGFLDRLGGRVEVDLTIDISLPVIGSRRKTHHFRVPIADGTFNYRELERDLAQLEDAFIDIEVRGRQLAIERRIPFVPGLEKPLILFDLDDRELDLARRRLVRLATIATLRRPVRSDDSKSSVQFRELDFRGIDLALTLAPPPEGTRDVAWGASASKIAVQGELHYAPNRPADSTRGRIVAENAAAGPGTLPLGSVVAELDRITAGRIEVDVRFERFAPREAKLVFRDLAVSGVRIGPPRPPGRAATAPPVQP